MSAELWRRTIDCLGVGGRERELGLTVTDSARLCLIAPPGEQAIITVSAGDVLKNYITEAQRVAAELALGFRPTSPAGAGLKDAKTFHVFDAHGKVHTLGIGVSEGYVVVNGSPRQWQVPGPIALAIATKLIGLGRELRDRRTP